jgi:hypothetical protein
MVARISRPLAAALCLALVAGCAPEPAPEPAGEAAGEGPADTRVVDAAGLGSDAPSFTVRRQGRLMQVLFLRVEGGVHRVVVMARSGRGLDRSDARTAYDAAYEAAQQIDCGGGAPPEIDADSATFQEDDRRTALTQGAPAWIFRARCG